MGGLFISSGGTTGGVTLPNQAGNNGKFLTTNATTTSWSTIAESNLTLTDVTTANVSTTAHGFTPKLPNDATKFLNGTGTYTVPPAGGKDVRVASANPALTFSSSSTSYVDITGMTCTLSLDNTKTYNVSVFSTPFCSTASLGQNIYGNVVINGSQANETRFNQAVANQDTNIALMGFAQVTGLSSCVCKLQGKISSGTMNWGNGAMLLQIFAIATEN
jgi:hypothetical protein